MAPFTDLEGEQWNLRMTYYDVQEIQERTDITLMQREPDEEALRSQMLDDPETFMTLVWIMVRDQAQERDMTEQETKVRLSRGPFLALVDAFTQAFYDFLGVSREEAEEEADQERPTEAGGGEED